MAQHLDLEEQEQLDQLKQQLGGSSAVQKADGNDYEEMDANHDNMLSLEEILEFYDDRHEMKLTRLFEAADKSSKGYVTKEQFGEMKQRIRDLNLQKR